MNVLRNVFLLVVFVCVLHEVVTLDQKTEKKRLRRDTVRNPLRRWPNGVVPYTFALSAGLQTRTAFRAAIYEIQRISCVRFVRRTTEVDYVRIITGDGCYSIIGRDGGRQDLSLGDGCYRKRIAVHETLHLLGFFHEQSRLDRDEHVTVHYYNTLENSKRQFKKYKPQDGDTLGEEYDPDSIMHYSNSAFSKNGRATITYVKDPRKKLGQRDQLSKIDIRQLNKLYKCAKTLKNNSTLRQKTGNKTAQIVVVDKCRDDPWSSFSGQCTFYSFMGNCYHSPRRMSYLCPKTCGYCRPTCIDTSDYCTFFSFYGYCLNNSVVRQRCRKTCGICRTA